MKGKILGNRYELIEKIGGGGMAFVYKAKCKLLNRYVAIKILKPEFVNDQELVKRFKIEAQSAASLSHPNIVSIYDVGCEDDMHYIVMEYVDGETLKEYIETQGVLKWQEAIRIALEICSAIEHAHKNKIIHRDIKPHNILLTKTGVVKVTDFGIARATTSSTMTMAGKTIGSVHYISPEQARGGFVDEKSDLYSLGIVIYEMLTGKVPFDAQSPVAVALKHIQEMPQELIGKNPDIPSGLNTIVMKAINKQQNYRYQSATELKNDMKNVLEDPSFVIKGEDLDNTIVINSITKDATKDEEIKDAHKNNVDKKERLVKRLAIATAVVIMMVMLFFCANIMLRILGFNNYTSREFVVADYVGKNFYEVKGALQKEGILVIDKERVYSDTVPNDVIISQNKQKGDKLKPGGFNSNIEFKVSKGPKKVRLPDLKKEERANAIKILEELGLDSEIIEVYDKDIALGRVVKTSPAQGIRVEPGSTIEVYVSKGMEIKYVEVPDLIGCKKAQAEQIIKGSKLVLGAEFLTDKDRDTDIVCRQEPKAHEEVEEGSIVDIYFGENPIYDNEEDYEIEDFETDIP